MSHQAVTWAIEVRAGDPTLKILLMAICHHADRETWACWPSQELLAFETEVSKRTIQRKLEELQTLGFIRIEKRRKPSGEQDNSIITVIGRQIVTLHPPVDNLGLTGGQNPASPVDTMSPPISKQSEQEEQSLKAGKSKKGMRIPSDWQLTADLGNFGRSKGLHRREVESEAEKFKNYWTAKPGAAGLKLDWAATWRNWIISAAGRLGRSPIGEPPPNSPQPPAEFDRQTWENLSRIYASSNNWHREWGPEPGRPQCAMPPDLQQRFVNSVNQGLTAH